MGSIWSFLYSSFVWRQSGFRFSVCAAAVAKNRLPLRQNRILKHLIGRKWTDLCVVRAKGEKKDEKIKYIFMRRVFNAYDSNHICLVCIKPSRSVFFIWKAYGVCYLYCVCSFRYCNVYFVEEI